MLNIVLLGPPGAGKGTQAELIVKKYHIPQISTGDIFRANIKGGTELGKKAQSYMDKGELVPDELVVDLVRDRLNQDDCAGGFMLDGFPRTVFQAEELDKIMKEKNLSITKVLNIEVEASKLIDRIAGRRVCKACGATYNVNTKADGEGRHLRCLRRRGYIRERMITERRWKTASAYTTLRQHRW